MPDALLAQHMKAIDTHLRGGRLAAAQALCAQLAADGAASLQAQLMLSHAAQRMGAFDTMLDHAEAAARLDPAHVGAQLRVVESLIYCCQVGRALQGLAVLEAAAQDDARLLQELAQLYLHCAGHAQAARCHERAAQLAPDQPDYLFNLGYARALEGDGPGALNWLREAVRHHAADGDAHLARGFRQREAPLPFWEFCTTVFGHSCNRTASESES